MKNQIQVFQNEEFGKLQVIQKDGQTWFVGKEVAGVLGYGIGKKSSSALNNAVNAHVEAEDKGVIKMVTPGGKQNVIIINESGLYSLILSAKLPSAKAFKRWVTVEVLPTIRKHGAYATAETLRAMQNDPKFTAELLRNLRELHTKAYHFDTILQSPKALPVSVIAKDYGMSAFELNRLLHDLGIQYQVGKTWVLYKAHAGQGYTLSKTFIFDGEEVSVQTCWTMKGRLFIYNALKKHGILPDAEKGVA